LPALAIGATAPAQLPPGQPAPEIPFESVADPVKLSPNMFFGEVTGVAVKF